jgi:hypothetical protein
MVEGMGSREREVRPGARRHEEYLELCAVAASGNLTEAEQKDLREHAARCVECREALREFESVVDHVLPELATALAEEPPPDPSFSQDNAEAAFRKRLADEKERERTGADEDTWLSPLIVRRSRSFRRHFDRYQLWLPLAASLLLCAALGILTYRMGKNKGIEWARLEERDKPQAPAAITEAREVAPQKSESNDVGIGARDAALASLRREIAQKSSELDSLKALLSSQQLALQTSADDKKQLTEERDRLAQRVSAEEASLRATEERLKSLDREQSQSAMHTATLEAKVAELSNSIAERERLTAEQQDLLAKDRDIRELMGARDLYITEIHDVVRSGEAQKAFGRVFYTRGKSLIFYAYDLNETPGVKEASTFEAWGRRGPDWKQAYKLGVFYEDNASKRRWVAKSNDKKTLDQIDAVFVTVEPNGGSQQPTGKPLLFAYLKVTANHP